VIAGIRGGKVHVQTAGRIVSTGSLSVAGFVEDMVAARSEQLRRERAELARGSHERRFEVVSLILEGAPITSERAGTQLGYDLRRQHTALVLGTGPRHPDQAASPPCGTTSSSASWPPWTSGSPSATR
jgi:hypothetical protein